MLGEFELEPEAGCKEGPGQAAVTGGVGFLSSDCKGCRPDEAGGPRLLRWEIRGFLDIKGSMKSVSGRLFWEPGRNIV